MKIFYTPIAGLVHRVQIVARELGLEDSIEWVPTKPYESPAYLLEQNPLSKVPTLVTDNGLALFPSHVIYEYLDSISDFTVYPSDQKIRWLTARLISLGEGLMEMVVMLNNELKRPLEDQSKPHVERYESAVKRVLNTLDSEILTVNGFFIGHISVAGTLNFVDVLSKRYLITKEDGSEVFDFRKERENLSRWYTEVSQRPAFY